MKSRHVVYEDKTRVRIGGLTFKRAVLPSVATRLIECAKIANELQELDTQSFKEVEADEI